MIFKLAFRNLFAHKVKSGIIVFLIALATFLTVLGFGILNYAKQQTESVCRSDFCGDIFISGKATRTKSGDMSPTLFGVFASGIVTNSDEFSMPYLMHSEKIIEKLKTIPSVTEFSRGCTVQGIIKPPDSTDDDDFEYDYQYDSEGFVLSHFLGINVLDHKRMYDSVKIYAGKIPESGEFLILPRDRVELYEKNYKKKLNIGDTVLLYSFRDKSKTLAMTVRAFYDYAHPETDIDSVSYIDFNSARILGNMTVGAKTATEIPQDIDLSISELSEEELFSENFSVDKSTEDVTASENKADVLHILGDTSLRDSLNLVDANAWHYITVKLDNKAKTNSVIKELNTFFKENNISATAAAWDKAMLMFSARLQGTKVLMISVLLLLSIVSIVVIMNTMVVSIMERSSEIGTMRAIGAKKSFVRKMFLAESMTLGLAGLFIGVLFACILSIIFNISGLPAGDFFMGLFGFSIIRVALSVGSIILTASIIMIASLLATLYPLAVALQISPLEAITKS